MKRIKNFFIDFKKFISRGNILDLAVAMVVGSAFTAIVTSLVNDIIMPFICAIFGSATVEELYFLVNGAEIYYGKSGNYKLLARCTSTFHCFTPCYECKQRL